MRLELTLPDIEVVRQRAPHLVPLLLLASESIAPVLTLRAGADNLPTADELDMTFCGGWVVLIGDDCDKAEGPGAFPGIKRYLRQATHVTVMSGAPVVAAYGAGASAAAMGCRVVMVETQVGQHEAWRRRVQKHAPRAAYLDVRPR